VYQSRHGDDALIVSLNTDDAALQVVLGELGAGQAQVIAGSGAPPEEVVDVVSIEPHGWRILRPV
jgi:cyclomaltodextrinase / maltogenic alpha-amylase / neopullulanase